MLTTTLQPGAPPADIIFKVKVKPHRAFTTLPQSLDLQINATLSLQESLFGLDRSRTLFYHLDGRPMAVNIPRGTRVIQPEETVVVTGEGMRKEDARAPKGNLYITFKVELPDLQWVKQQTGVSLLDGASRCSLTPVLRADFG